MDHESQQRAYADLIICVGVNLQPGQALRIRSELGNRDFTRKVVEAAYRYGCRYVYVEWTDPVLTRLRLDHSRPDDLDFIPEYEVNRYQELLENKWATLTLVGSEYPDVFDGVEPNLLRRAQEASAQKFKFWFTRIMNNELAWSVAAVPTTPWAQKMFPDLERGESLDRLWQIVLRACRADQPDPIAAWHEQDAKLRSVVTFMDANQVRTLHFLDEAPGPDGQPATNLMIGLCDRPHWEGGSAQTADGRTFFPNIPTEEVFSTPHNQRTEGWARTTKPFYPFQQEVTNAYFRFEQGALVEFHAGKGQEALEQFFQIRGVRRLGEVALVDVRSPINQSGLLFYNTLFDENAACHIAFGRAYPVGVQDGHAMDEDQLKAAGVNDADVHLDVMVGTATMHVYGICADGRKVPIMQDGQFTPDVVAKVDADQGQ